MSMKNTVLRIFTIAVCALFATVLLAAPVSAEKPTPGFNTKIPESIMTPDKVETRIGTLEFFSNVKG
ncbi:MAG: hypothetical protein ACYSWU_11195 [Planctomycetota bacterium]